MRCLTLCIEPIRSQAGVNQLACYKTSDDFSVGTNNVPMSPNVVSLDIGSSSVRSLLFDNQFEAVADVGWQEQYEVSALGDGRVEIDPQMLLHLTINCIDRLHDHMAAKGLKADVVGISAFWHCFLGIDENGSPTTPIIHLFDTRSGEQVEQLTHEIDPVAVHARTGCVLHTSYWPAKLLWLKQYSAAAFNHRGGGSPSVNTCC